MRARAGRRAAALLAAVLLPAARAAAQPSPAAPAPPANVEENVVFGRHFGLALLLDVHRPAAANGRAVVYVPGSGFHAPAGYDARPITVYTRPLVPLLLEAGYTVFAVNHRAAPAFRHPAALEDAQRAVRWVRHHAARYGVSGERMAAAGYSSGGTLASLLGVLEGPGDPSSGDAVQRASARVQCVVAGGAAFDFPAVDTRIGLPVLSSYLGATIALGYAKEGAEHRLFRDASPVTHVSAGDADHFIFHGEADEILPVAQAQSMADALRKAGVPVTLVLIPGGTHGRTPPGAADYRPPLLRFLGECLERPR